MKSSKEKISIYVRNATYTPSNYYRIIQYTDDLPFSFKIREGLKDQEYLSYMGSKSKPGVIKYPMFFYYYTLIIIRTFLNLFKDILSSPTTVIVSKSFCPKYTPLLILFFIRVIASKSRIIWDFDDDIFFSKEISMSQASLLQEKSNKIIVTGENLKQKINVEFREKVKIMPTTDKATFIDNLFDVTTSRLSSFNEKVILIWVGTAGNLFHVEHVINELDNFSSTIKKKYNKKCELRIICDKELIYDTNDLIINNIKWERDNVKFEMSEAHIGIMPLIENEFTKGKGGFKIIQYLSAGLPVIASGVGINKEIITPEVGKIVNNHKEWIVALESLIEQSIWIEKSESAQHHWENKFSYKKNLNDWIKLILDEEI